MWVSDRKARSGSNHKNPSGKIKQKAWGKLETGFIVVKLHARNRVATTELACTAEREKEWVRGSDRRSDKRRIMFREDVNNRGKREQEFRKESEAEKKMGNQ